MAERRATDGQPAETSGRPTAQTYYAALELAQFKSGFLARTSHELRSPLNGLISGLQLILSDLCDSPEEAREYIQIAHDSAFKLVELLDTAIQVSKVEYGTQPLRVQALDLDMALQEVYLLVRMLAQQRNIRLQVPFLADEVEVTADAACLRQVLMTLIDIPLCEMQEGSVTVSVTTAGGFAQVLIEDDRPDAAWQEAVDLLGKAATPDLKTPIGQFSSGYRLLMCQSLMHTIGGPLELIEVNGKRAVRCSIPLVS
jgi:signal transduction histidine kinase